MQLKSTISVALCTYNGAKFLPMQLESIKQQSMPVDELIVCDDASTDETIAILTKFKASVSFAVSIHQNKANLGSSKNFEKCLGLCTQEVIFLCDQDDVWEKEKVETMCRYLVENPTKNAVFTNAIIINQNGFPTGKTSFDVIQFTEELQQKWQDGWAFDILVRGYVVTGAALALKKSAIPRVLPVPNLIPELIHDGWISLLLSIHNEIGFIEKPLLRYREHLSQQVGLKGQGKRVTLLDRFSRARGEKLLRLQKKHYDCQRLLTYFKENYLEEVSVIEKLTERASFYLMRSSLSHLRILRIVPVFRFALRGAYKKQDGGKWWRPLIGDLFE